MRGLSDFVGSFDVSRVIEDHRAEQTSRFEGTARIAVAQSGAEYVEIGTLIMNDMRFEAERRYLWRGQGARIAVAFADGAPFHDFDPVLGGQATEHLCGEDMYRGGYDVSGWPSWAVTWDVSGPRKDYRSITRYHRL